MPDVICAHGDWICAVLKWGEVWKSFFPLFGSMLVALTAAAIGIIATWRLNTAMKQTEFFLKFTERFHDILAAVDRLNLRYRHSLPTTDEERKDRETRAHELYRQFFGLLFDEFYAYQRGFLERQVFTEWMRWRYFDANLSSRYPDYKFEIAGVPYLAGWKKWTEKPAFEGHTFVYFMNEVHRPRTYSVDSDLRALILRYAPRPWRLVIRLWYRAREDAFLVITFGLIALAFIVASMR